MFPRFQVIHISQRDCRDNLLPYKLVEVQVKLLQSLQKFVNYFPKPQILLINQSKFYDVKKSN